MGETTRHPHTHVAIHDGVLFRIHRPLSLTKISRIRDHAEETNHELVLKDIRVLSRCNKLDTKVTESVLIQQMRPSLSNHEASVPLNTLR